MWAVRKSSVDVFCLREDFLGEVQVPDEIIVFCHKSGIKVPPDIVAKKFRPERFIVIVSETEGVGIEVFGASRFVGRREMDVRKSADKIKIIKRDGLQLKFSALSPGLSFILINIIKRWWPSSDKVQRSGYRPLRDGKGRFYPEIL